MAVLLRAHLGMVIDLGHTSRCAFAYPHTKREICEAFKSRWSGCWGRRLSPLDFPAHCFASDGHVGNDFRLFRDIRHDLTILPYTIAKRLLCLGVAATYHLGLDEIATVSCICRLVDWKPSTWKKGAGLTTATTFEDSHSGIVDRNSSR